MNEQPESRFERIVVAFVVVAMATSFAFGWIAGAGVGQREATNRAYDTGFFVGRQHGYQEGWRSGAAHMLAYPLRPTPTPTATPTPEAPR